MVGWDSHVTDYYNIVFVYSNTCGFYPCNLIVVLYVLSLGEEVNTELITRAYSTSRYLYRPGLLITLRNLKK